MHLWGSTDLKNTVIEAYYKWLESAFKYAQTIDIILRCCSLIVLSLIVAMPNTRAAMRKSMVSALFTWHDMSSWDMNVRWDVSISVHMEIIMHYV